MTKRRLLAGAAAFALTVAAAPLPLARLAKTGTVDERFQGYNIAMVEVTGAHHVDVFTTYVSASGFTFCAPSANALMLAIVWEIGNA